MPDVIHSKAWKGATYGVRVGKVNAQRFFDRRWKWIDLEIDGQTHRLSLSPTFWTTCPEVRSAAIGRWLSRRRLVPWPRWRPTAVKLMHIGGRKFRLLRDAD